MSVTRPHPHSASWPAPPVRVSQQLGTGRARGLRWSLLARWHSESLDRELAAGADPQSHPLMAARAHQLTTRRSRLRLAAGLAQAGRRAADELAPLATVAAPDRHEVLRAAREIAAVERRLRGGGHVHPGGAAMLCTLLGDGTSLLYDPVGPGSLSDHLRAAGAALEPDGR